MSLAPSIGSAWPVFGSATKLGLLDLAHERLVAGEGE